jgi:hypothetical protein
VLNNIFKAWLVGSRAVGTPEKIIIEGMNKYVDIGVTHFILHFIGLDEKKLFNYLIQR